MPITKALVNSIVKHSGDFDRRARVRSGNSHFVSNTGRKGTRYSILVSPNGNMGVCFMRSAVPIYGRRSRASVRLAERRYN